MIGRMHTQLHTDWWFGFFKYHVEVDPFCHDIHTKFHKDRYRHSEGNNGGYNDTQLGDLKSILYESRLKMNGKGRVFKLEVYFHIYFK
jgi:hypothetical protein